MPALRWSSPAVTWLGSLARHWARFDHCEEQNRGRPRRFVGASLPLRTAGILPALLTWAGAGGFGESQALQKAAGRLEACATDRRCLRELPEPIT